MWNRRAGYATGVWRRGTDTPATWTSMTTNSNAAWAIDHKMTGEGLYWYKGAWPYEGGGYWFDGLARLGYALHDDELIQQAKNRLYAVADNMNSSGILFLWWLNRNDPSDRNAVKAALEGWPLWACGLLGRTMTGYYAGSGDKHVLETLEDSLQRRPRLSTINPGQHIERLAGV